MSRRRGLAPLVGAGMAAVAAGSLVLFSLLAQQTALSPEAGQIIVPRAPLGADGPTVTLPPPSGSPDIDGRVEDPFIATTPAGAHTVATSPSVGPPFSSLSTTREVETRPGETLLASLDLPLRVNDAMDFQGPVVGVQPTGADAPSEHTGPKDCTGEARTRDKHRRGGSPACSNPHGGPPGQLKKQQHSASGQGSPSPASSAGRPSNGGGSPNDPPSSSAGHSSPPPKETGGGGPPEHASGGGSPNGSPSHPHAAPPGQAKKESAPAPSNGNGAGAPSGHPHGAPPGQGKKKG